MHSALRSIDIVNETVLAVSVTVVVLESHLHVDVVFGPFKIENLGVQNILAAVEIGDELLDPALKVEDVLPGLSRLFSLCGRFHPHILQSDLEALCQKSHLSHSLLKDVIFKYRSFLEHDGIRHERNSRTGILGIAGSNLLEGNDRRPS